ncbi:MAG: hypothetical protein WCR66_05455 [Bacteroidota bacterium]
MLGIKFIKRIKYLLFLMGLLFCSQVGAQIFGGNPAKQKWLQYDTDSVRVIFPHGMEDAAMRIVKNSSKIQQDDKSSLGSRQRKISVVLQNGRPESNAYVGLAPWRSEFYTIAPQDPFEMGAVNWIDNLTIHEFRHVQQYSNFNKGLSNFAYIILGEQGLALANSAAIPDWFFEGDAVYNETKFSPQGRGKLALFISSYKSLYLSEKHYTYMQMRNGSFRKYTPNHYELGYLLVTYGRKKYGDAIWSKICADAVRFKPLIYPFQNAVKKYTGVNFQQFVHDALNYYQTSWKDDITEKIDWVTNTTQHDVVDYRYPYETKDGSIIVLRKSLKDIPGFYLINHDGTEHRVASRSIAIDDYYSYKNDKIIYASYQPDIRWGNRAYNAIKLLDLTNAEEKTILSHTKYYSPDISKDGEHLLAIELDPIKGSSLMLLDQDGKLLNKIHKAGWVFASPKFSANDQSLYVTARNDLGEMSLLKKSFNKNDSLETILPFENRLIGYLNVQGDTLIYTLSNKGRDEMWATILNNEKPESFRLATYPTGLYQGFVNADGKLISSAFSAEGYRLAAFKPLWEPKQSAATLTDISTPELYNHKEEGLFTEIKGDNLLTKKYPSTKGLIRFHSWRPMYADPEYTFSIYGDNVLNTFHTDLSYTYNQNEGSHKMGITGVYGGSYVQPIFGWSQIWSRSGYYQNDTLLHWNESNVFMGLHLPLNLSGGKSYRLLNLTSTYHFDQLNWTGLGKTIFRDQQFNTLQSRVDYVSQIQQSQQQILPHWGYRLSAQYKTALGIYTAHQLLLSGSVYLPGFSNNHGVVVTGAYFQRDTLKQYLFSNNFPFSRGYTAVDFPRMWKLAANYHLPVAYPEWGLGNLVYFSRVRMNIFYDYTRGKSLRTGIEYEFASTGGELYFDTRWWNQQSVSFGVRFSHLLNNEFRGVTQPNVWEFIVPVNLF